MINKFIFLFLLFFGAKEVKAQTDTTKVILSNTTARLVIKDLVSYDYCLEEVKQYKILVSQLEKKNEVNDAIISTFSRENKLQEEIKSNKDKQITNLEKDLKRANNKTIWTKVALYGSLIFSGYLILSR